MLINITENLESVLKIDISVMKIHAENIVAKYSITVSTVLKAVGLFEVFTSLNLLSSHTTFRQVQGSSDRFTSASLSRKQFFPDTSDLLRRFAVTEPTQSYYHQIARFIEISA